MGAVFVERSAPAMSEAELQVWVKNERAEQAYESGNDAYAGNWAQNRGLEISRHTFSDSQAARKFVSDKAEKWGPCLAVRVGDFANLFPKTAAERAVVQKEKEAKDAVRFFDFDIMTRARAQKSEKKTCAHCGSGVNLKKMWAPTRAEYTKALESSGGYSSIGDAINLRGKVEFVVLQGITDCPVCQKNLLLTESDKKKKETLIKKSAELTKKLTELQNAHKKKVESDAPFWFVGAWCGT